MRNISTTILFWLTSMLPLTGVEPPSTHELPAQTREQCLTVLRQVLTGPEFWPAMHAAEALTIAGHGHEVVPVLEEKLLTDNDAQHRCGLAREIVRTGKRDPLPILWNTLADPQSNGRVHAAESLYKIAEVGDGKLLRSFMLDTSNPKLSIMCAATLGRAGNQLAMQTLRGYLKAEDPELRKLAAWALGLLGSATDIPAIRQLCDNEKEPVTKSFFVNALACLGEAQAREEMAKNIDSEDPAIRTYAADFATWARHVEAVKEHRLADSNVDVRARTAQALLSFTLPIQNLGLPVAVTPPNFHQDVFVASDSHPRYSEGSIIVLRDGSLLYATTRFVGGGADHATASIVAKSSKDGGKTWGPEQTLQENIGQQNVMSVCLRRLPKMDSTSGTKRPELTETSPLGMFFLVKNSSTDLKVVLRISTDEGRSFQPPIVVTSGPGYHVMNNDRVTMLASGRLVCSVAWSADVSNNGHFVCSCFLSDDGGLTWRQSQDKVDQPKRGAMEPEVVELATGKLLMIVRTQLGTIATSMSEDGGDHWSAPGQLSVQAPESPATIRTIPSTGDLLLVWNNTFDKSKGHGGNRSPLTAAISRDAGVTWENIRNLETDADRAYAYTSVLFHKDRVLFSYYVGDVQTGKYSSRFRSLPVRWLYEKQ
ncbi:MAG: exo-alpha-sialidase [Pirellulaceae bacterium]|nr:exo-alpha-sialidase [Pirellulaceae bacterium]